MPRLDPDIRGPERPSLADIDPLNRMFAESFTDRYRRDGMAGVRVPQLNPSVWRYAIEDAGAGAMVWRDAAGEVAAFNMVHRSGSEGWMGPLAVRPDRQQAGLGTAVVRAGVHWLEGSGATTIGLETMPRTVDNIGFYGRLGFVPRHLTVSMTREVERGSGAGDLLSAAGPARPATVIACRALTESLVAGVDFTRELELTDEFELGDTSLVHADRGLVGFALWHGAPLAAGRPREELRVLKLAAASLEAFEAVVAAVEQAAAAERVQRIALRCQTAYGEAFHRLLRRGYQVHWTDLRMTLAERPERMPGEGVLWSNWEI